MKNILFYYPSNNSAVSLSSLMIAFQNQGHNVFLLTLTPEGDLHNAVKIHKVACYTNVIKKKISISYYYKHIKYLSEFTCKHNIDIVYSHLQQANFIAAFAQIFSKSRFLLCRHHSDSAFIENNRTSKLFDKLINKLGKEFIAPSHKVYNQMVISEKVNKNKIHFIKYAYNFEEYPKPNHEIVKNIRDKYRAELLLVKAARLIGEKRHILLFRTIKKLVEKKYNIKLIILSEGYERTNLEKYIAENNLQNHIFMLGFQRNVINYLTAADVVVHVSASEASNNLIKEAALVEKPVIVCHDVGDFDDYVINNENGIVLTKNNTEAELFIILEKIYKKEIVINAFGKSLNNKVRQLFSIENVISEYDKFHQ